MEFTKKSISAGFLVFILASILGLLSHELCEPWFLIGDATEYLKIYNGEPGTVPFGYRVLTPYLARLLPWDPYTNFGVVTISSLSLASSVMTVHFMRMNYSSMFLLCFGVLWFSSFPFIYYSSTLVRADGPVFLILTLLIYFLLIRAQLIAILALIIVGVATHEMILVYPVFLLVDKGFGSDILHTKEYSFKKLMLILMIGLGTYLLIHVFIKVDRSSAQTSYLTSPADIVHFVISYSGGILKHIQRIYASYGPSLIFCLFYIIFYSRKNAKMTFFVSLGIIGLATFLATDTLRIMAVYYFIVFLFAVKYINEILEKDPSGKQAIVLLIMQLTYSYLVYGHLRTFELSESLYLKVALLSVATVAYCAFISRRKIGEVLRREVSAG